MLSQEERGTAIGTGCALTLGMAAMTFCLTYRVAKPSQYLVQTGAFVRGGMRITRRCCYVPVLQRL